MLLCGRILMLFNVVATRVLHQGLGPKCGQVAPAVRGEMVKRRTPFLTSVAS